jgi:integrase/recombinase XerD
MGGAKGFAAVVYLQKRTAEQRRKALRPPPPVPKMNAVDGLRECLEIWAQALQMRHYAAETVADRRYSVQVFIAWAAERDVIRAGEVTRLMLEAYQRFLWRFEVPVRKGEGTVHRRLSWCSQRERLRCLKAWFQWLTRQNLILHNPASELELPRREKRLPKEALSREEVARLLAVPNIADPLGVRDRAILEVFYATGLRRAEVARVAIEDINTERGTLTVRQGKGSKDRVVPLGARAAYWCDKYTREVRPLLSQDARVHAFFLSAYGEGFNPDVISRMVSAWLKVAGLAHKGSCHLLRHSCATHMLEGGADIRYIQQLLGHANLDTTSIYTQVTITQLLAVHARCHPGAPLENTPSVGPEKPTA